MRINYSTVATVNLNEILVLDQDQQFVSEYEGGVCLFKPQYVSWKRGVVFDGTHYYFKVQVKDELVMEVNGVRLPIQKFFGLNRRGEITFELSSFKQGLNDSPIFEFRLGDFRFNEFNLAEGSKYYVRRRQSQLTGKRPTDKGENQCLFNRLSAQHIKRVLRINPKPELRVVRPVIIMKEEDWHIISEAQMGVLDTMVEIAPHLFGEGYCCKNRLLH